jgi:hypothetical protein
MTQASDWQRAHVVATRDLAEAAMSIAVTLKEIQRALAAQNNVRGWEPSLDAKKTRTH